MSNTSLRFRIALVSIIMTLIMAWLMSFLAAQTSSERLKIKTGQELAHITQVLANQLMVQLGQYVTNLMLLDDDLTQIRKHGGATQEMLRAHLVRWQQFYPHVRWVGIVDASETVVLSSPPSLDGQSFTLSDLIRYGQQGFYISDLIAIRRHPQLAPLAHDEDKLLGLAMPLRRDSGTQQDALVALLSWQSMTTLMLQYQYQAARYASRNIEFFIVDQRRLVLSSSVRDMEGETLPPIPLIADNDHPVHYFDWPGKPSYVVGTAVLRFAEQLAVGQWYIVARLPADIAYADANTLQRQLMLSGTAIGVIFALSAWFLAGIITRPLSDMAHDADRVAAGLLRQLPILGRGGKEIRILNVTIRRLIEQLSHREEALHRLDSLAHRDLLTGLFNRVGLMRYINELQALSKHEYTELAVLYVDLDHFKPVNDGLGHAAGDELLTVIAERLRRHLRDADIAARIGGDEFLVLVEIQHDDAAEQGMFVANRIIETLRQPISVSGRTVTIGCSIGVALYPEHGDDIEDVISMADRALYQAKSSGRKQALLYQFKS